MDPDQDRVRRGQVVVALHKFVSGDTTDDPTKVDGPEWNKVHSGSIGHPFLFPSAAITVPVLRVPFAFSVTNIRGRRVGGTGATINVRKNGSLLLMASALSLAAADTWYTDAGLQNATFAAGDTLEFMIVSTTGSPESVLIQVDF